MCDRQMTLIATSDTRSHCSMVMVPTTLNATLQSLINGWSMMDRSPKVIGGSCDASTPISPLDVPQFGSVVTTVVKQYYEYGAFALGTPNSSLFDIPDICNATNAFDWCATFFSRGLITLYDNPVLGAS